MTAMTAMTVRSPLRPRHAVLLVVALIAGACSGSSAGPSSGATASADTAATADTAAPTIPTLPASPASSEAPPTTAAPRVVRVEVIGDEEVVFDYSEQACGEFQRPDLPARAYRSADGSTSIVMAAPNNTRLVGPSLDEVVLSCDVIRSSSHDHDPAAHAHFEWIAAVHTDDGQTVHAVIHNEYHGYQAALADSRRALLNDYGDTGWSYLARTGAGTVEMSPAESGYRYGDTLCSVDFWGAHPDVGCAAVRRWTAPADGRYVIDVSARRTATGGDGVVVSAEQGDTTLLSAPLDDGAGMIEQRLDLTLAAGEHVDFVVDAGSDASFDGTDFSVLITPDGEVCQGDTWECQQVELTAAVSTDGGATFSPSEGASSVIASPGVPYRHDVGLLAMWQPSNIVRHPTDGHLYMLAQFDDRERSIQLTCLFRTATIDDPASWRAWDGEDFSLSFAPPATDGASDRPEDCASVLTPPIGGLTWNTHLERFVAIGGFTEAGPTGQYLTTSTDLVEWTPPVFIQAAEFVYTSDVPPFEPYATLIDPSSESMSYDTSGETPYLYFSRINAMDPLDFDLVRVPLRLDYEP